MPEKNIRKELKTIKAYVKMNIGFQLEKVYFPVSDLDGGV